VIVLAAGASTIGYAAAANSSGGAQLGAVRTTTPIAESAIQPPEAIPVGDAVSPVPAGIVLLTDPAWVLRVSEASGIPTRALSAYAGADLSVRADTGCTVGWNTLAAIGYVESEHGTIFGGAIDANGDARPDIVGIALDGTSSAVIPDSDRGELDGDPLWDRAVGPMQFIPDTWKAWGADGNDDGVADANNIDDAALTAARYLCHAHGTLDGSAAWIDAIRSYNANTDYQNRVAVAAAHYADLG